MDPNTPGALSDEAAAARSPTRRRLLALLAGLPAAAAAPPSEPTLSTTSPGARGASAPGTIPALLADLEALLVRHDAALRRCDRLEAWLQAETHPPRVRLPVSAATPPGTPATYAADPDTIARHVPLGRKRYRLWQVLLRRQQAWARGARACGLTHAQEQEAARHAAVRAAADGIIATPAATLADVRTKIVVLLAVQEPGAAFRDSAPWRELRLILADLARMAEQP